MPPFDPDAYLAATSKSEKPKTAGFDPDAYLAATTKEAPQADDSEGVLPKIKELATKPLVSPQGMANNLSPLSVIGGPGGFGMTTPDAASPFKDKVAPLAPDIGAITNDPEKNKAEPWKQGFRGAEKGLYNIASGMTSPLNLGMLAGGVAMPGLGMVAGATQLPSMFKGAYQGLTEGKAAREGGEYEKAGEKYVSGASNLLMALGLAKGLGKVGKELWDPSDPYSKAKSPEIKEIAKEGYPLNPAEITGKAVPNSLRSMFRRNPIENQKMNDFGLEQEAALNKDVGLFKEGIGEPPPALELGEKVKGVLPGESYAAGVKGLKSKFAEQEAARLAKYANDTNALKSQFSDQEFARQAAHDAALSEAESGLKAIPKADPATAGAALDTGVQNAYAELNKNYSEQTSPLIKKYLNKSASPEGLRKNIVDILDQNGLIDEKGNILREDINTVISPSRKAFLSQLADISEGLVKNPTIKKLSQVTQDLQDLANFGASERTPTEKMFGKLSHSSKESLLDSLEPHVGPENVQAIRNARAAYAATRPVIDELSSATANKYGSQIVGGAKTALPPELLGAAAEKIPQLKGPLGDVVVNNIIQKSSGPEALTKMIDSYGRENLQNILGPEQFKVLTDAEANYLKAATPFEKALPPQPIPFKRALPPEAIPQSAQSKFSEEIGGVAESNPNAISEIVVKPGNVQRVRMAKQILGDQFDAVKRQFTQNLIGQPKIQKGQTEGSIAGSGLKSRLGKYGDEVLSEIYTPEELSGLKTLANKANISESAIAARGKSKSVVGNPMGLIKTFAANVIEPPLVEGFLNPRIGRAISSNIPVPASSALAFPLANSANREEEDPFQSAMNYLNGLAPGAAPSKNDGLYKVNPAIVDAVQNVKSVAGYEPTITSGFRTQAEQDALNVPGKAKVSYHSSGNAIDQRIKDLSPEEIEATLKYYNSIPGMRAFIDNGNHIHLEKRS